MGARLTYERLYTKSSDSSKDVSERMSCMSNAVSDGSSIGIKVEDVNVSVEGDVKGAKVKADTTIPGIELSDSVKFSEKQTHCGSKAGDQRYFSSNSLTSTNVYAVGSRPTSLEKWTQQEFVPLPIRYELTDIAELFNPKKFGTDLNLASISAHGGGALNVPRMYNFFTTMRNDYCSIMLGNNCPDITLNGCGLNSLCPFGYYCIDSSTAEVGFECIPATFNGRLDYIEEGITDLSAWINSGDYGSRTRIDRKDIVLEVTSDGVKIIDANSKVQLYLHEHINLRYVAVYTSSKSDLFYLVGTPEEGYQRFHFNGLGGSADKVLEAIKSIWSKDLKPVTGYSSSHNFFQVE